MPLSLTRWPVMSPAERWVDTANVSTTTPVPGSPDSSW